VLVSSLRRVPIRELDIATYGGILDSYGNEKARKRRRMYL
jgi:hypothetical protein